MSSLWTYSILEKNYNRISCIHPHTHMVRALGVKGTLQFLIIMHKSSELKIKHWIFFFFVVVVLHHTMCAHTYVSIFPSTNVIHQ